MSYLYIQFSKCNLLLIFIRTSLIEQGRKCTKRINVLYKNVGHSLPFWPPLPSCPLCTAAGTPVPPRSALISHTLALSCNFLSAHLGSQDALPVHTKAVFIHLHYCHILYYHWVSPLTKIQWSFFFYSLYFSDYKLFFHACKTLLQAGSLP